MSTNSNICVLLKEEDRNKTMKHIGNEHDDYWGSEKRETGVFDEVNPEGKEILYVYCHWDGYPDGVGAALLAEYTDYDNVLNLVLGGDMSSVGKYYANRKGEKWEHIQPQAVSEDDIERQEYDYLFKDGEWFVRAQYDSKVGKNWKPLKKYLNG